MRYFPDHSPDGRGILEGYGTIQLGQPQPQQRSTLTFAPLLSAPHQCNLDHFFFHPDSSKGVFNALHPSDRLRLPG
jgi:hypothetical protein